MVSVCRPHDGGPGPAEDGVRAGAGSTGRLLAESEVLGGGDGPKLPGVCTPRMPASSSQPRDSVWAIW